MAQIIEVVSDNDDMTCPFCKEGFHGTHDQHEDANYEGPTPEPGACWGWDRISDKLCICPWRPEVRTDA